MDRLSGKNGVLEACRTNRVSFIAYSPSEHGLLTGTLDPAFNYPDGDFRKTDARFSCGNVTKINTMLATLQPLADRYSFSISQLMIAWTLSQYDKMHIISGMRNVREVEENARVGETFLPPDVMQEIETIVDRSSIVVKVPQVFASS
jgi:aryl-alcohol dehydrogenase-like predicted oxidoreductase